MYAFTRKQQQKALIRLSFWHMVVIVSSNYLVQYPFELFGLHNTWGAFTFPFIFLTTDLTVRIFGASMARKIIFCVMWPSLVLSYLISVLFHDGHWAGWASLQHTNVFVIRIALASFTAYVFGQLMDITVFNRLRRKKAWWAAPAASSVFGSAADTLVFFSVAFYMSPDVFMAQNWPQIALMDYCFKLAILGIFFLPAYGVLLGWLTRKLTALEAEKKQKAHLEKARI